MLNTGPGRSSQSHRHGRVRGRAAGLRAPSPADDLRQPRSAGDPRRRARAVRRVAGGALSGTGRRRALARQAGPGDLSAGAAEPRSAGRNACWRSAMRCTPTSPARRASMSPPAGCSAASTAMRWRMERGATISRRLRRRRGRKAWRRSQPFHASPGERSACGREAVEDGLGDFDEREIGECRADQEDEEQRRRHHEAEPPRPPEAAAERSRRPPPRGSCRRETRRAGCDRTAAAFGCRRRPAPGSSSTR